MNSGYQSKASAVIAGRPALLEFLEELAKEAALGRERATEYVAS